MASLAEQLREINEEISSKKFTTVMQYDQPKNIYLGDSTVIHALGEGKVRLPTVDRTYDFVLDLHKVLFVPKLTKNLTSVPAMALMGAEIRFDKDKF